MSVVISLGVTNTKRNCHMEFVHAQCVQCTFPKVAKFEKCTSDKKLWPVQELDSGHCRPLPDKVAMYSIVATKFCFIIAVDNT